MKASTRANIVLGSVVTTVLLIGTSIGYQIFINATNDRQDIDIQKALYGVRESQYRACILNGNALRDQVRAEFVSLKRAVLIPVFSQVAETIPMGAPSRSILDDAVARMQTRISTIKERIPDVDCLAVYPPLPGQHYPKIDAAASAPTANAPKERGAGPSPRASAPAPSQNGSPAPGGSTPSSAAAPPSPGSTPQTAAPSSGSSPAPPSSGGDGGGSTSHGGNNPPPPSDPPSSGGDLGGAVGDTVGSVCTALEQLAGACH